MSRSTLIWRVLICSLLAANIGGLLVLENVIIRNDRVAADLFIQMNNTQNEIKEAIKSDRMAGFIALDKAGYASNTAANTLGHVIDLKEDINRLQQAAHLHMPREKTTAEPR